MVNLIHVSFLGLTEGMITIVSKLLHLIKFITPYQALV